MQRGLFLDIIVSESPAILQLLPCKDETLLVGGNTLLVLNLGLDTLDGITALDIQCNGLSCQSLHEDLHYTIDSRKMFRPPTWDA